MSDTENKEPYEPYKEAWEQHLKEKGNDYKKAYKEGFIEGIRKGLKNVIEYRFKKIPLNYVTVIDNTNNKEMLIRWGVLAMNAETIDEIFISYFWLAMSNYEWRV